MAPVGLRSGGFFILMPTKKITYLVDGFNLYHSVRKAGKQLKVSTKWLDLKSLCISMIHNFRPTADKLELENIYYIRNINCLTHIVCRILQRFLSPCPGDQTGSLNYYTDYLPLAHGCPLFLSLNLPETYQIFLISFLILFKKLLSFIG